MANVGDIGQNARSEVTSLLCLLPSNFDAYFVRMASKCVYFSGSYNDIQLYIMNDLRNRVFNDEHGSDSESESEFDSTSGDDSSLDTRVVENTESSNGGEAENDDANHHA
jgi:hypothetical protein